MKNLTRRHSQDEAGQWWYRYGKGKNKTRTKAFVKKCGFCGDEYLQSRLRKTDGLLPEHCSRTCGVRASYAKNEHRMGWKGADSPRWKGGRRKQKGYVTVFCPGHPSIKFGGRKYVLEHRLVMERILGRFLGPREIVHHKNGIKDDNKPKNLELWINGHPSGQRHDELRHCETCTCFGKR